MRATKLVLAMMLAVMMTVGLTGCSQDDNPVIPDFSSAVLGQWYSEDNTPGSFDAHGITIDYQKSVIYASFRENGSGFWSIIFVDEYGDAIDIPGYFCGGAFSYVVKSSNTINIKLKSAGIPILNDSWDVIFDNGRLYVVSSEINHALAPITDEQNASVQKWLRELGLGGSPEEGNIVDLATLESDYTAQDGDVLTGTTTTCKVTIADGATVTLNGVSITNGDYCMKCKGSATIVLADGSTNNLTCSGSKNSSLMAGPEGTAMTIQGFTGELNATGGEGAAGIGGGRFIRDVGSVDIQGGIIKATGGKYGAGIGTGSTGNCGDITISGGTVEANGGLEAAGIGCGRDGYCGNITITTGVTKVTATRGIDSHYVIGKGGGNCVVDYSITFGTGGKYNRSIVYQGNSWNYKMEDGAIYGGMKLSIVTRSGLDYIWILEPAS